MKVTISVKDYRYIHIDPQGKMIWSTKDGRKIFVEEMSDGHIKNVMKFLQRNGLEFTDDYSYIMEEHLRRVAANLGILIP